MAGAIEDLEEGAPNVMKRRCALVALLGLLLSAPAPTSAGHGPGAALAPLIRQRMAAWQVPGVVVGIWTGSKPFWTAAFGVADLATRVPMGRGDHMRIGSITKTFVGTVILQLADEGRLRLSDPVAKFLPGVVPNGQHITIRQLGTMTSGLFNYSEDAHFQQACFASPARAWTPPQLLAVAFRHPPRFAPGKGFEYSNTNTILLGMVIERITGRSVADALRTRIFQPLGMRHTLFPRDTSMPAPYAHGYVFGADIDRGPSQAATLIDVTHWNPSWGWTAGAVISTLDDLSRFIRPLAKGSLVSARAQTMRLAGMDLRPGARSYGFAIANLGGAIGHNGALPGYQSFAGYLPDRDTTVIVLTNLYQTRNGKGPADQLAALIIARLSRR